MELINASQLERIVTLLANECLVHSLSEEYVQNTETGGTELDEVSFVQVKEYKNLYNIIWPILMPSRKNQLE